MERQKIKSTSKYPTTLIVKGMNYLGAEIAKRLIEQGGYVVIVDSISESADEIFSEVKNKDLLTILDMSAIGTLQSDLRRLDYVFYFSHEIKNFIQEISSQEFLQQSNYLDQVLDLSIKFNARFLLTTSIKAHQLIIESKNPQLNESEIIPKYSETEIQRYAENLVSEYTKKLNLDSRIIRLGELLGKGLNPSTDSEYINLITSAIEGKPLAIQGDGLESDFYVHYIDSARGLIQAMFSMNTRDKTYSLAIPEEISILSIAYRIAELEPTSGEIKFVQYASKLPPLRLYKPAPNLQSIGWQNKINLNRSLAQSIEYIKERMQQTETEGPDESMGDFEDKTPPANDAQGALARLITERKFQEKTRLGSVVVANENLRKKMGNGNPNIKQVVSKQAFWIFEGIKQQFAFLKKITLKEFVFALLLILILTLIYIFAVSPVLNIVATAFQINWGMSAAEQDINSLDLTSASNRLNQATKDIENVQNRLADINFMFVLSGKREDYSKLQNSLEIQKNYVEGLYITIGALDPLYSFLQEPNFELIYRLSDDVSLLEVKQNSDAIRINEIANSEGTLKLGVEKLKLFSDSIISSLDVYPSYFADQLRPKLTNINNSLQNIYNLEENYQFIPSLLGKENRSNFITIIQDNSSMTPSGGEFAAYLLTTFENGILTNIELNSFDKLPDQNIILSSIELEELNLVSTQNLTNTNINIEETTYINNLEMRSSLMQKYFEQAKGIKVDAVSWITLSSVKDLLATRSINFEERLINQANFESEFNTLVNANPTRFRKNDVISEIFAQILLDSVNNKKFIYDLSILGNLVGKNDLSFYSNDIELKTFFNNLHADTQTNDFIIGSINTEENTIRTTFPRITITGNIVVKNDGSTTKSIQLKTNNIDNLESAWSCFPAGSKNFSSPGIESSQISRNFTKDRSCQIFLPNDRGEYVVNFETLSFENPTESLYNYSLTLSKPVGVQVEYELEFTFESSTNIQPETNPQIARINNFTYSGTLNSDLIFNFYENE